jgi:3-methyladenine DNA glycosylase Mpg
MEGRPKSVCKVHVASPNEKDQRRRDRIALSKRNENQRSRSSFIRDGSRYMYLYTGNFRFLCLISTATGTLVLLVDGLGIVSINFAFITSNGTSTRPNLKSR